jgi:alpha-1,3-rhamnosyl/mannosyltransferase
MLRASHYLHFYLHTTSFESCFMTIIGFNALCFSTQMAGISTYAYHLFMHLPPALADTRVVFFVPTTARSILPPATANVRYVFLPIATTLQRIAVEQTILPLLTLWHRCIILHTVSNVAPIVLGRKNIVTIHDVYFLFDHSRFGRFKNLYLRLFVYLTTKTAGHILTVSNYSRTQITNHYHVPPQAITVTHEGIKKAATHAATPLQCVLDPSGSPRPFFLFVGTLEPGKNLLRLVQAFEMLPPSTLLVLVGKQGWGCEELVAYTSKPSLASRVLLTGYLSEQQLSFLYQHALAFVFPSIHEGFGLPLIEAMQYGCPVCCSNSSCLPEIADDAALYFDPHDCHDICRAMQEVQNEDVRARLIKSGYQNIARFSWESCAQQTAAAYYHALKGKRGPLQST